MFGTISVKLRVQILRIVVSPVLVLFVRPTLRLRRQATWWRRPFAILAILSGRGRECPVLIVRGIGWPSPNMVGGHRKIKQCPGCPIRSETGVGLTLILGVPPCCLAAQIILENLLLPKQNWADSAVEQPNSKSPQPRSQT